jgi:hypothetical protein
MLYTIYKTVNKINQKEYIGFHSVKSKENILFTISENGSIFDDGYLGSGKLMKMALEKYGPLNMYQKLMLVTNDKKEAEEYERRLVNKDWVNSNNNYNVSLGGNVCILFGNDNGFFGKKHTEETINKIQEKRNRTLKQKPFSWCEIIDVVNNRIYFNKEEVYKEYKITGNKKEKMFKLNEMVFNGKLFYKSNYLQEYAIKNYTNRKEWMENSSYRKQKKSIEISQRFKGVPKTKESNEKRGRSISEWIKNNPEEHEKRMLKINKNPEKIKKMVEKQTGKIWITNVRTGKNTRHDPNEAVPKGWKLGFNKK